MIGLVAKECECFAHDRVENWLQTGTPTPHGDPLSNWTTKSNRGRMLESCLYGEHNAACYCAGRHVPAARREKPPLSTSRLRDLIQPTLNQLADSDIDLPLSDDGWLAELDAWKLDAESRSDRYPSSFVVDDTRETIYREREDTQL